ncbi:MAG TPA: TRAP transporter large permease [Alphaproteobacteria bacterium]|nr:TRAP transporter large permease [Alphaproteobacteria bacterium]
MILTGTALLVLLLGTSIPVAAALALLGLILSELFTSFPLIRAIGETSWGAASEVIIVSVPMFILMGEILLRSGVAEKMYDAMVQWFSWLPGGLMHSNIGACTMFAATSGSSAATAATISTVSIPEMRKHGYSPKLFLGSLAAGGTLGILIPPSINLIVYGVLTHTSIPQLYLAGFIPGFLLAALFMLTILVVCVLRPEMGGQRMRPSWSARLASLPSLLPPLALFAIVIGSIYAGWATPTESASLGVVASLVLAAANRRLNWDVLRTAIEGTMRSTAMIMLIFMAAFFLNFVISATGLTRELTDLITRLDLSPLETMIAIVIFYIVLGCFMETMAMMITTIPIIEPIIQAMGYDSVWFGIIVILLVETAMITPPVGVNLYIVQGVRGDGRLNEVILGALPFVGALIAMIGVLIAWPELALWLPNLWKQSL